MLRADRRRDIADRARPPRARARPQGARDGTDAARGAAAAVRPGKRLAFEVHSNRHFAAKEVYVFAKGPPENKATVWAPTCAQGEQSVAPPPRARPARPRRRRASSAISPFYGSAWQPKPPAAGVGAVVNGKAIANGRFKPPSLLRREARRSRRWRLSLRPERRGGAGPQGRLTRLGAGVQHHDRQPAGGPVRLARDVRRQTSR